MDNDIGIYYTGQARKYPQSSGSTQSAAFWRLYRTVASGSPASDATILASGTYSYTANKFGAARWFKYTHVAASGTVTLTVTHAGGCSQGTDYLDLLIYASGNLFNGEVGTSECPAVSFSAVQNAVYTFFVRGANGNTASYSVSVSP